MDSSTIDFETLATVKKENEPIIRLVKEKLLEKCELPNGYRKVKTKHDPLYDQALISLINEGKIHFTQTEKGFIYKSKSSKSDIRSEDAFKEKDSSPGNVLFFDENIHTMKSKIDT